MMSRTALDLCYLRHGACELRLDLHVPAAPLPVPVIIAIHGGGWHSGSRRDYAPERFLPYGFALASVSYRLSQEAVFPAQIDDLRAAVRWLRAHAADHGLDPCRFGAFGHSAGGHLAALLGTDCRGRDADSRVQAVATMAAPSCLGAFHGGHRVFASVAKLIGGAPADQRIAAAMASPVNLLAADAPPFLVIHGLNDDLVPFAQAELLDSAVRATGGPNGGNSRLLALPDTGHEMALDAGSADGPLWPQVIRFFAASLPERLHATGH